MSALGQKQTSQHLQPMSALPPKADIRILFDQLIGALLEKWGHVEAEQLGCLEIDHEFVVGRRLYREFGGLLTF